MLGIVGTVPDRRFPLVHDRVFLKDDHLVINDFKIPVNRGTPALIAAALKAREIIGGPEIYAFLVGDIGEGHGSRLLYQFLERHLSEFNFEVLTFHYLQPDVDWHNKVLFTIESMNPSPLLIADAGFMYAAKMSGQASCYDIFTPDVGELTFLADEMAPHPFYTRGFILHRADEIPDLISQAYHYQNAAKYLLVKGKSDTIVRGSQIVETVNSPCCEAMEAIGGTGDTLTGLLTVLCKSGIELSEAARDAALINRWAGSYAEPNPATQVIDLVDTIPRAIKNIYSGQLRSS
jgi:hypothetical protein